MIVGEKVRLRALQEEDAEDCWRWINDWDVVRHLQIRYPLSRLAERDFVERNMKPQPNDKVFGIETLDGLYIGNVGLHRISWEDRHATFGIFIGEKKYWGGSSCRCSMTTNAGSAATRRSASCARACSASTATAKGATWTRSSCRSCATSSCRRPEIRDRHQFRGAGGEDKGNKRRK
jgi:hypothetical protein